MAAAYQYYRGQGITPFIFLFSDAANISGFAAALDFPQYFRGDALLSDPGNFRFYATIHIPLLRALRPIFGEYGDAFMALYGPHVFLQMAGFYVLGRVIFKNRFWAVLLSIITMRNVPTGMGPDSWGVHIDAVPTFTFQALIPFVLAAAWKWRSRPSAWPLLMLATGLLMYVHPVSTPCFAFALWLGLWWFHPREWTHTRRIGAMIALGFLFLIIAMPFVVTYLSNHDHGQIANYEQIFEIMRIRYHEVFLNIPKLIIYALVRMTVVLLLPLGVVGAILTFRLKRDDPEKPRLLLVWIAGIVLVSFGIPLVEHTLARALHMIPFELDLPRGFRYVYPLSMIFLLWPLSMLWENAAGTSARKWFAAAGLLLVFTWCIIARPPWDVNNGNGLFLKPQLHHIHPNQKELIDVFKYIRNKTPVGARFFPMTDVLAVRYYGLRPVVFCHKDGGALGYSSHEKLLRWYKTFKKAQAAEELKDPVKQFLAYYDIARSNHAQYILIGNDRLPPDMPGVVDTIYSNKKYSVLKLK